MTDWVGILNAIFNVSQLAFSVFIVNLLVKERTRADLLESKLEQLDKNDRK